MKREVKEEAGLEFEPQALVCVETQGMSWVRFTFSGTYNMNMRTCTYVVSCTCIIDHE